MFMVVSFLFSKQSNKMDDDNTLLFRDSMILDVVPQIEETETVRLPYRDPDLSAREKELIAEVLFLFFGGKRFRLCF
jgi:hypothetical protein